MSEYPIHFDKVQAPPLRDDILARDRLLDWLSVKVHNRVVLLTAEAGYGKTTLLADFARRTRVRVLWFRLDHGDRDWVGLIAYLVAAVRVHVPGFGPATGSLLRETGSSAPSRESVLDTFLRELGELPPEPAALVFDDFHLVDDAPDVRHVVRELLARAPERLSFVFASRRIPPLRLARLRALGELAELRTDDLRFDTAETERLFREAYEMRLDAGLIAELSRRTEGWAASLQLVHAALHDRDAAGIRSFIRSLSGAEGHLYDYLAEEVVGDLPEDLQDFLMKTSLLDTVDLVLGPVAAGVPVEIGRRLIEEGERLGLFGRQVASAHHQVRAHPLVRDFLQARLGRAIGPLALAEIHRRTAAAAESVDWRIAAHHYLRAGAPDDARRVLSTALETILATGAYAAADEVIRALEADAVPTAAELVVLSRLAQQRGASLEGLKLAEIARDRDPSSVAVLLNLVTARSLAGDIDGALRASEQLAVATDSPLHFLGRAYRALVYASVDGALDVAIVALNSVIDGFANDQHYAGVALGNKAYVLRAMGQALPALEAAERAVDLLDRGSGAIELVSARLARAGALAQIGRVADAEQELAQARSSAVARQMPEVDYETAEIDAFFGPGGAMLPGLNPSSPPEEVDQTRLARAMTLIRAQRADEALAELDRIKPGLPRSGVAFESRRLLGMALALTAKGMPNAVAAASDAARYASAQGALLWARVARLLASVADYSTDPSRSVIDLGRSDPSVISMLADTVAKRLDELSADALETVKQEVARRPERWRPALRDGLVGHREANRHACAALLSRVGEKSDVRLMRSESTGRGDRVVAAHAKELARRIAPRVVVDDLGRVAIQIGKKTIEGSEIRRKVLALLCYLLSRPGHSASREEAIDALWPDQDPGAAMNSLNQTVYFLRRVFEPDYREDMSPGYLHQDGESLWLDRELVTSRSDACRTTIRRAPHDDVREIAAQLADQYRGRFALDFPYEPWAEVFRDALHAPYLRVMEHAIRRDIDAGQIADGIGLAERVHQVDPDSEEIQVALIRLYRLSGAFAAAAEQYEHYASAVRELGLEPTPLSEL